MLFSIALTQCSWWHPSAKPDSDQLWQTLPVLPDETISYIRGEPVRQVLWDERGNPKQVIYRDLAGNAVRIDHFYHPNAERLVQDIMSMPDSQLVWRVASRLEEGQVVERQWYNAQNKLLGRESLSYDAGGNLLTSQRYSPEDTLLRIRNRPSRSEYDWYMKYFDAKGEWRSYEVHSQEPFFRKYFLTKSGTIQRGEVRTEGDQPLWYYTESPPESGRVFVKIYSGTGQLLLQTQRPKTGYVVLTKDSIPQPISSIWSDGSVFHLERQALTDSTQLLTWRVLEGNLLLRKQQFNQRTNLPVEDIFYYSSGPRHPMVWYLFNQSGRIRRITSYTPGGEIAWVLQFDRDSTGQAIQSTLYNGQNELHETITYHHTLEGHLMLSEHRGPFGKLKASTQYFADAPVELLRERDSRGIIAQDVTRSLAGDTLRRATYEKLDFIWVGMFYDGNGRLTAQKRLTPDELSGQTVYFDLSGRRMAEEYLGKGGTVFQRVRYFESGSPFQVRENFSRDGELVGQDSLYLRPDGEALKMISRDEFGKIRYSEWYEYQRDTLRQKVRRNSKNAVMTRTLFQYDSLGNLVATTMQDSAGGGLGETRRRYDDTGRLIREQMLDPTGTLLEDHRYHYNPQGQLYREQILQEEQLIETVEYNYLPKYTLRVAVHYAPDGSMIRREIEDISQADW
ncbi:MAG: hypothetical protein K9N11_01055 [Lentisphaeria bacterium]|nr:hypothetical protein [Candidatus Neomarinimicrobiota bacterium]MCF7841415.1 hypothetical protein [Lentisphaeria bacterium]